MLHARRRRLQDQAKREADGDFAWTGTFPIELRRKIGYAFIDDTSDANRNAVAKSATTRILRDEGWAKLPYAGDVLDLILPRDALSTWDELNRYLGTCEDAMVPTVIEALYRTLVATFHAGNVQRFLATVNDALAEHRVAFELIGDQMVEVESRELHTEVVAPVLALLAAGARFASAETAYRSALDEIARGSAGNAITDAGTALQEALAVLGCNGDNLGAQIASAKKKGLLGAHDAKLTRAIEATLDWASANRSQRGDAHHATDAERDDAWLMVHVVGALVLRLSRADQG